MKWVMKSVAVALAALALLMPPDVTAHCGAGDQAAECTPECVCECHLGSAFSCLAQACGLTTYQSDFADPTDMFFIGRLLIVDIFRPPASV
jgi:hypothetical protein